MQHLQTRIQQVVVCSLKAGLWSTKKQEEEGHINYSANQLINELIFAHSILAFFHFTCA